MKYDMLILEQALNNVSYPIALLYRLIGKKVMYWGHGKDFKDEYPGAVKIISEYIKILMTKNAHGLFSYTKGVSDFIIAKGYNANKVFCLDNTVDITSHREAYNIFLPKRNELRSFYSFNDAKVLLYVGRLNKRKRIDFLIESFYKLRLLDKSYRLIVIGTGDVSLITDCKNICGEESVLYVGSITNVMQLAPFYVLSDAYVFPGDVGLGPLQALCYDLTPIVIDSNTHGPEYEYLNSVNSIILAKNASVDQYVESIRSLCEDKARRNILKQNAWPSISKFTIENMAINFINGVNDVLSNK
jgi:glycosyltransferase involved in cell wall biosynthesis